jgi:hypothetical protein
LDRAHHTPWAPRAGNVGWKAGFVNRRKSAITGDQDTGDHGVLEAQNPGILADRVAA